MQQNIITNVNTILPNLMASKTAQNHERENLHHNYLHMRMLAQIIKLSLNKNYKCQLFFNDKRTGVSFVGYCGKDLRNYEQSRLH